MGKRNRQQRADKQRANKQRANKQRANKQRASRQRADQHRNRGAGEPGSARPGGRPADSDWQATEALAMTLLGAAEATAAGLVESAADCAGQLLGPYAPFPARAVLLAATVSAQRLVAETWRQGWQPEDLHQIVRRRLQAGHLRLLVDVLADEAATYSPAALHARWREQLAGMNARVWWAADTPVLAAAADRHGQGPIAALTQLIELLALLLQLPQLQRLLPLPGTRMSTSDGGGSPVDERALAKVRALLAKAESTQYSDEAEALSAKAQELMTRHSLQRVLRESSAGREEPVTARRVWLDAPYAGAKALLVQAVAEANRCRAVWTEVLGFVTVVGDERELVAVEVLATSLLVQATRAMVSHGRLPTVAGRSRTRSFRQSFLIAYATRIGERLSGASAAATREFTGADAGCLLPVLAATAERVDQAYRSMFPRSVERSVAATNGLGWAAGRAAADLALLDYRGQITEAAGPRDEQDLASAG